MKFYFKKIKILKLIILPTTDPTHPVTNDHPAF